MIINLLDLLFSVVNLFLIISILYSLNAINEKSMHLPSLFQATFTLLTQQQKHYICCGPYDPLVDGKLNNHKSESWENNLLVFIPPD